MPARKNRIIKSLYDVIDDLTQGPNIQREGSLGFLFYKKKLI